MPTLRPVSSAALRTLRKRSSCSSYVPWLRFKRATSIPASTRALIWSYESVAGPRVQTIFARRMYRAYDLLVGREPDDSNRPTTAGLTVVDKCRSVRGCAPMSALVTLGRRVRRLPACCLAAALLLPDHCLAVARPP